jgi:hypothetical protein
MRVITFYNVMYSVMYSVMYNVMYEYPITKKEILFLF